MRFSEEMQEQLNQADIDSGGSATDIISQLLVRVASARSKREELLQLRRDRKVLKVRGNTFKRQVRALKAKLAAKRG